MAWDFTLYGINMVRFERGCFNLLLNLGFSMDECTEFATLLHRENRLENWHRLVHEFLKRPELDLSDHLEAMGITELYSIRSKNTCFGLNQITLWYVNRFGYLSTEPVVPYKDGSFFADKETHDGIVDWVTTACAYVEQQTNEDFVWDHWDVELNESLLLQVKEYFGENGWQREEYVDVFGRLYHPLRKVMGSEFDWFYWEHSY
jgi:hypothetical protein